MWKIFATPNFCFIYRNIYAIGGDKYTVLRGTCSKLGNQIVDLNFAYIQQILLLNKVKSLYINN